MNTFKILFAIPTINSYNYIVNTLKLLNKEKELFDCEKNVIDFAVCVNGDERLQTITTINEYDRNIIIIETPIKGKNNALNELRNYAIDHAYDIIHFFDDDILAIKKGSIKENIRILLECSEKNKKEVIVGSNFFARKSDYMRIANDIGYFKGFIAYLMQYIYELPYKEKSDINYFLSGVSICLWVRNCPVFPDDALGIADDSFLSNYFGLLNKPNMKITNIIKPKDSIVYFLVPYIHKEWYEQQKRVMIGVEKSFLYFSDDYDYLQSIFKWRYSEYPKYRINIKPIAFLDEIKLLFFRILQKKMVKDVGIVTTSTSVSWNSIDSSKIKK